MKYSKWLFIPLLIYSAVMIYCCGPRPADLVLRGGKIVTVDKDFSFQEAVRIK